MSVIVEILLIGKSSMDFFNCHLLDQGCQTDLGNCLVLSSFFFNSYFEQLYLSFYTFNFPKLVSEFLEIRKMVLFFHTPLLLGNLNFLKGKKCIRVDRFEIALEKVNNIFTVNNSIKSFFAPKERTCSQLHTHVNKRT